MITPEQEKQQQAEYTRSLLDAVYQTRILKQQKIQQTRRHIRLLKEKKNAKKNA